MFNKDLLVLDIESTGTDVTKHEIIQLAGILLDKKTLKEKKVFSNLFLKLLVKFQRDVSLHTAQLLNVSAQNHLQGWLAGR